MLVVDPWRKVITQMGSVAGEEEGEAIRALGSLFKLTQVHLWDDGSTPDTCLDELGGILQNKDTSKNLSGIANNRSADMGMIKEMKALGLPVSFQTNKEWKNRTRGRHKKGIRIRSDEAHLLLEEEADKDVSDLTALDDTIGNAEVDRDSVSISETVDTQSYKLGENRDGSDEWKVYWDSFYGRSYFYNVKTQESTWQPPVGMEHLAYDYETHNLDELSLETTEKHHDGLLRSEPVDDVHAKKCEMGSLADTSQETPAENQILDLTTLEEDGNSTYVVNYTKKAKKRTRRTRAKKIFSSSDTGALTEGVVEEDIEILGKYWCQRYLLFSRFDEGIKMDEEGWYSVTPESIAKHHATRCNRGIVIDCFTGVGGNAIQFASRSNYVIAIDLDPKKLELAHHNAVIYGVSDKIDFVKGDFFDLAHNLKAGTVFLSPPWGGPDYVKSSTYDMKTMLRPRDGDTLFKAAINIAPTIIMFLPRNVDINQLAELALSTSPPWSLEVEENYLNGKLKAITAYYFRQEGC